jgi:hypothetical protein
VSAVELLCQGDPTAGSLGLGTWNGAFVNNGASFTVTQGVFEKHAATAVTATGTFTMKKSLALDWGTLSFISGATVIEDSAFVKNQLVAVSVEADADLSVSLKRVLIEGSLPYQDRFGLGVSISGGASVSADALLVSGGSVAGVLVTKGATAKITHASISGVAMGNFVEVNEGPVKTAGDGVVASEGATLDLGGVDVRACARVGLLFASAAGSIASTVSTKNQFGLVTNGSPKPTVAASASFAGNSDQAQVSDSDLAVPVAPAPIPH